MKNRFTCNWRLETRNRRPETPNLSPNTQGCYTACWSTSTGFFCTYFNSNPTGTQDSPSSSVHLFCAGMCAHMPMRMAIYTSISYCACMFAQSRLADTITDTIAITIADKIADACSVFE